MSYQPVSFRLRALGFFPAIMVVSGVFPAWSQDNVLLEEIVVTAQRREQPLQEVPVAVTAYDAEQLQRLQVVEALDTTRLVPNFIGHNNTGLGTANAYSLRGLNNTESIATFDPPVGSYVDDIYVARQNANNFTLFDVDRIEVLRGPQGTLFGRNTTGGAVRVILKKPSETLGGYLEGGYGEYDRFAGRGSVDIPVSNQILTKFSGYWIEDDGYVDNLTTGETLNSEDNYGLRAAALWQISEGLSWDLALDYEDDDHANMQNFKRNSDRISRTGLTEDGTPLVNPLTSQRLLINEKGGYGLGNEVESFNVTSNIEWDSGIGTVSFITGWRDMTQEFALDFLDGNAAGRAAFGQAPPSYGGFTISNDGDHDQFTQEIKLAGKAGERLDYVAGLYYLDEDNRTDFGDIFDFDLSVLGLGPPGTFVPLVLADRILKNTTEAWAVYAQGDYAVTDQWIVTLGIRYTDEDKDVSFHDNQPCVATNPACGFADTNGDGISDNDLESVNMTLNGVPLDQSEELWTPRVAVQYLVNDALNFYVSATRGFKSGGWNARGTSPEQLQPFDSEIVWSYEAGMRSEWLDNRLRLNVTAFWADVSDFQLPSAFTTNTGGIVFITKNFADMDNKGIELELLASPVDNLTLLAAVGFQDAEYENPSQEILVQQQDCRDALANGDPTTNICGVGIVDPNGNIADPVRVPDYTATLGGSYVWEMGGAYELIPSAYLYTVGDHSVFTSGLPQFLVDGYTTYNASLELANRDQDWSLILECKNCNDRTMLVSGLAGLPYYQDPRTWDIRFRKGFGGGG